MNKKPGKEPQSLAETMIRRAINISPMARAAGISPKISEIGIPAPSLQGLSLPWVPVGEITEHDVLEHLYESARKAYPRIPREPGEPIQVGDDVRLTLVAYSEGAVVPFVCRREAWVRLGEDAIVEGLDAALEGLLVGESAQVTRVLPDGFPDARFSGKAAVCGVRILEATGAPMLDLEAPEVLRALKKGDTLEDVLETVAAERLGEAEQEAEARAIRRLMEQLGERVAHQLPESTVDEEVSRLWMEAEGRTLMELNLPAPDREGALNAWMTNPEIRNEARTRVAATHAVWAIYREEKVTLSPADIEGALAELQRETGITVSVSELAKRLQAKDPEAQKLFMLVSFQHAVSLIVEKIRRQGG